MYMTNAVNNTLLMARLSSLGGQSASTYVRASHVPDIMQRGFAAVSLLLLAPLFLIISLLIKLTSQGPILCRGLRIGKCGRVFTIYEFCTLRAGAEEKSGARLLTGRDAYYTRIGKFLTRTKLDATTTTRKRTQRGNEFRGTSTGSTHLPRKPLRRYSPLSDPPYRETGDDGYSASGRRVSYRSEGYATR